MYRVVEIFSSIDGEGSRSGRLAQFIRLAGCNLRCSYCDTRYAWDSASGDVHYRRMSAAEIVAALRRDIPHVTLTGGEPLAAAGIRELMQELVSAGFRLNVETNGAVDIAPMRVADGAMQIFTVDYKLPSSGMETEMYMPTFDHLSPDDVVKFVVGDEGDIAPMLRVVETMRRRYAVMPKVYIGVVWGQYEASRLVEVMLGEPLLSDAVLQLQIHKFIWSPDERGV